MATFTELETFVQKFKYLWKSGQDAHLDIEAHAGQAWVGLRLRLGEDPGTAVERKMNCSNIKKSSPARERRRATRAAQRVRQPVFVPT